MASSTKYATTGAQPGPKENGDDWIQWNKAYDGTPNKNTYAYGNTSIEIDFDAGTVYTFSFAIPTEATISGFEIIVHAYDNYSGNTIRVQLVANATVAGGGSANSAYIDATTTKQDYVLGGPTDQWGESYTVSEINNSTFGVILSNLRHGTSSIVRVYSVEITCHYTEGETEATKRVTHGLTLAKSLVSRIHHMVQLYRGELHTITHNVQFVPWDPDWWNSNYIKRRPVEFGNDHDNISIGSTPDFEMLTGYEERIATNAVANEAIAHNASSGEVSHIYGGTRYTFCVWLADDDGESNYRLYIRKRNHDTGIWGSAKYICDAGTGRDTHYYPNLAIDGDGYLHIAYGCHDSPLKYRKSSNPNDEQNWGSEYEFTGTYHTYPRIIIDNLDRIYIFARGYDSASPPRGYVRDYWGYYLSSNGGASWTDWIVVVDYSTDKYYAGEPCSVYCGGVHYDKANDRIHAIISWWEKYGSDNKGRAVSHIYSDNGANWYHLTASYPNGQKVGDITHPIEYNGNGIDAVPAKQITATMPNGPFYYTNNEACKVDGRGYPYYLINEQAVGDWLAEPSDLRIAIWSGSAWVVTNLSGLTGSKQTFYYRSGYGLYISAQGTVYVYVNVDPVSSDEYGGAELYVWRGYSFGTTWSYDFISKNTGWGLGSIACLPDIPSGGLRELFICRGYELYWLEVRSYPYVRRDGEDLRIIRHKKLANDTYTSTPVGNDGFDRFPDRFGAEDTIIFFKNDVVIPEDKASPHTYNRYYVYYANSVPGSAPVDPNDVFTHYNSFESYTIGVDLDGIDGWVASGVTVDWIPINFYDADEWNHTSWYAVYSGYQALLTTGATGLYLLRKALALDEHHISVSVWPEAIASGGVYPWVFLEIYNSSTTRFFRVGIGSTGGDHKTWYQRWNDTNPIEVDNDALLDQRHLIELKIDSDGVTVWIDGVALIANDTSMTSATHFGFGGRSACEVTFDHLIIKKYVANPVEGEVLTEEGEDLLPDPFPSVTQDVILAKTITERTGHSMSMAYKTRARVHEHLVLWMAKVLRLTHDSTLEDLDVIRIAHNIVGDKHTKDRVVHDSTLDAIDWSRMLGDVTLEVSDVSRIIHNITEDKLVSDRVAERIVSDKHLLEVIVNSLVGDKAFVNRVNESMTLEMAELLRFTHAVTLEEDEFIRAVNNAVLDASIVARVTEALNLDKADRIRVLHAITSDKHLISRLTQDITLELLKSDGVTHDATLVEEGIVRIVNDLSGNKMAVEAIHHTLSGDKIVSDRVVELIVGDKTFKQSVAHSLTLAYKSLARYICDLSLEDTDRTRIVHNMQFGGAGVSRITNALGLESADEVRVLHAMSCDKHLASRIMSALTLEVASRSRVMELIVFEASEVARVSNTVPLEDHELLSIAHDITLNEELYIRVANSITLESIDHSRILHILQLEDVDRYRIIHSLTTDKMLANRITHLTQFAISEVQRVAHAMTLEEEDTARILNSLVLEKPNKSCVVHSSVMDKILVQRLANTITPMAGDRLRVTEDISLIASGLVRVVCALSLEVSDISRIVNTISFEGLKKERLTHLVVFQVRLSERLSQYINLTSVGFERIAQILQLEDTDLALVANTVALVTSEALRVTHGMPVQKIVLERLTNTLNTYKYESARMYCLIQFVPPAYGVGFSHVKMSIIALSDVTMKAITFNNEEHSVISLSDSKTLKSIRFTNATMEEIETDNENMAP